MSQFNAASRLCNILDSICKDAQPSKQAFECIAKALGISNLETNSNELSQLFVLLSTVEENIRALRNIERSDQYLASIREFHNYLIQCGIWQLKSDDLSNLIKQKNLVLIFDACASHIANEQLEHDLTENQVKDFLEQAEVLLKEITDSDLQPDIKKYLIVRLEEICSAMRHYSTDGAKHLSLVVEASIGGLLLRQSDISQDKEQPVWKKLLEFLLTLGKLLEVGANVQRFVLPKAEEIAKWLLPPGQ